MHEDASALQTAVVTPINRTTTGAYFSRGCLSPAKLTLLADYRQRLNLLQVYLVQIEAGGRSTILAEVNGLLLRAIHDHREMDRGFFLMAFRTKHDDGS